jgi:glycosyltransferase involved in cell wall biosynthesis
MKPAIVYVCKARPLRAGGGLGVAYNFLGEFLSGSCFRGTGVHYLFCGEQLLQLPERIEGGFDEWLLGLRPGSKRGWRLFVAQASVLRSLARRHNPLVILTFTPWYAWPMLGTPRRSRIVRIHSEHSKGGRHHELAEERGRFGLRERFVRQCVHLNFCFADHAVFPSSGAIELFKQQNPNWSKLIAWRAVVIHNGVEVTEPAPTARVDEAGLRVVSIAHHVREKGLLQVAAAIAAAAGKGLDIRLVNFGKEGAITTELQEAVNAAAIGDRFECLGLRPPGEVRAALQDCHVVLHLPQVVVFDLSLLEAMMQAVPVITSRLPGNVEALGDGYPLYAATPEEAAGHLAWIASNREAAAQLGRELRSRALALFSNQAMARRYLEFIEGLATAGS